ncbi:MCE family protein [Nocardioides pantholopis]|nr:MCE family protein [Nocardioides pantholopis]
MLRTVLGMVAGAVLLTGCDFDVYQLPLPGGTDVGDDPITITASFVDVLDLVPRSAVKVNDVNVGEVREVSLDGYTAEVTLELRGDTELPDNARAEIRQTSLLGEKFVSLSAPESPKGVLESGDRIALENTGRNPEVEEVLGALSLVLNGGGIAQLKSIASEINLALDGREDSARSVLTQVDQLVGTLDANKADIVRAIESLNRLAVSVRKQQGTIDAALEELPSALTSLDSQREDLVRMLEALDELGDVGVDVVRRSKSATIATVRNLEPVLSELANSGDSLVNAFHVALTYPFVDEVVGRDPQVARNLHMGDYTNLSIELDIDLSLGITPGAELPELLPSDVAPGTIVRNVLDCLASADFNGEECKKVRGNLQALLTLREECQKPANRDTVVCRILNQVPGLPTLKGVPTLPELTGDLAGGLGRNRPAPGAGGAVVGRGLTGDQLRQSFDPALVDLLVPGLIASESAPPARTKRKEAR